MASLIANTKMLGRFAATAYRHRSEYASWRDVYRAFGVKLSVTNFGKRFMRPGVSTLKLLQVPWPVAVRRGESDYLLVEDIFHGREYRPVETWDIPANARIVDLGANVGIACVYFASLFPKARIVAVEPDANNRAVLEMNGASLIASGQLTVVAGFAAATDGEAGIDRNTAAMGFTKVEASNAPGSERIACYSASSIFDRLGPGPIDLLKCDIEGSERELFADCAPWIGRVRRLVVETHSPYSPSALYRDLDAAGWKHRVVAETRREGWADCFLEAVAG